MVKSYLKYERSKTFGVITSPSANIVWTADDESHNAISRKTGAGKAVVGANEELFCWDLKKGELLVRCRDPDCNSRVTAIAQSKADKDLFAAGYDDGSIRIWDMRIAEVIISFNGHRSGITTLSFDEVGVILASGSRDTDIIIWDLVAEVGLFKLRGHKDQITALHFIPLPAAPPTEADGEIEEKALTTNGHVNEDHPGFLLTTGKDSFIKLWDLSSQHCIETHVAQTNGECWAMGVYPDDAGCITAGNDGELKMWSISHMNLLAAAKDITESGETKVLKEHGIINRQGRDRPLGVRFHPRMDYFAVHGSEKAVEIWRVRSEVEIQKVLARKRKRRREKAAEAEGKDGKVITEDINDLGPPEVSDVFVQHLVVRTGGKVRSMDWAGGKSSKTRRLVASTTNNQLEVYDIDAKVVGKKSKSDEPPEYNRTSAVEMPGHRTDIRSLALSSDDRMLASAANGSLKIWNVRTESCIRTLDCGYALCSSFLPGDKIVIVGNKNGELELFDIASSTLIDTVQAHDGPIWTLQVHPDGKSVVSGSADKTAKFWTFTIIQESIPGTKRTTPHFKLTHTRTLKVSDDILSLRFSPDSRLLAVALLDNTVKVFFTDSLKLFLNLYGHRLPVLDMSISYDSKLIVTCSADKNVRLWGLDFGDCHKAFFAHTDSIMQVAFVPHNQDGNGHHFFSASKDMTIKYWDADKFEQIQKLSGHHGEIWALAVSRTGDFLVSASHDKSIRAWIQTDEQVFLEEERERELEQLYESTLTASLEADDPNNSNNDPNTTPAEAVPASKQTTTTLIAGERISEALDLCLSDLHLTQTWQTLHLQNPTLAPPQRNPIFLALGNITCESYLQKILQKIPPAALQDALLILPFSKLPPLFTFLSLFINQERNIPLTCRILFFMLKTHQKQIVASSGELRGMLEGLRERLKRVLGRGRDQVGFNLAAVRVIGRRVGEIKGKSFVDGEVEEDAAADANGTGGSKKRAFVDVA
ncbi:MAG: hypothetical protein M1834_002819 [Cirrosporium novae-zelandiae]|nr:MAG: hypothetical protein M1834_002819 [Cirrosporium novae-zelandiae]